MVGLSLELRGSLRFIIEGLAGDRPARCAIGGGVVDCELVRSRWITETSSNSTGGVACRTS